MEGVARQPWVIPIGPDRFLLNLPDGLPTILSQLGGELRELLANGGDLTRRVFPVAYPDDADREAGYQALIRGELIERHQAGVDLIAETAHESTLTEAQLSAWMTTINALRLILAAALDIQDEGFEIEDDDPRMPVLQLYEILSVLLGQIVTAFDDVI